MAHAYAFHGHVALNTAAGTIYLTPDEARKLGTDLQTVARGVQQGQRPERPHRVDMVQLPPEKT